MNVPVSFMEQVMNDMREVKQENNNLKNDLNRALNLLASEKARFRDKILELEQLQLDLVRWLEIRLGDDLSEYKTRVLE